MAAAIDTARLALDFIPQVQRELDRATGGRRRFQIHRVSVYATIPFPDSEIWRQSRSAFDGRGNCDVSLAKREALDWQADPDDDLGDAAALHHLHQQAATVPLLSSVLSQRDHGNGVTTFSGSALSASINATTQGRHLSSFDCFSFRKSCIELQGPRPGRAGLRSRTNKTSLFPSGVQVPSAFNTYMLFLHDFIVWAGPRRNNHIVLWQMQVDVVDLYSRRTLPTSHPGKRRRTAFNQFLQVSHSPVIEDTSWGNPLPHASPTCLVNSPRVLDCDF